MTYAKLGQITSTTPASPGLCIKQILGFCRLEKAAHTLQRVLDTTAAGNLNEKAQNALEAVLAVSDSSEVLEACKLLILNGTALSAVQLASESLAGISRETGDSLGMLQQALEQAVEECMQTLTGSGDNGRELGLRELDLVFK